MTRQTEDLQDETEEVDERCERIISDLIDLLHRKHVQLTSAAFASVSLSCKQFCSSPASLQSSLMGKAPVITCGQSSFRCAYSGAHTGAVHSCSHWCSHWCCTLVLTLVLTLVPRSLLQCQRAQWESMWCSSSTFHNIEYIRADLPLLADRMPRVRYMYKNLSHQNAKYFLKPCSPLNVHVAFVGKAPRLLSFSVEALPTTIKGSLKALGLKSIPTTTKELKTVVQKLSHSLHFGCTKLGELTAEEQKVCDEKLQVVRKASRHLLSFRQSSPPRVEALPTTIKELKATQLLHQRGDGSIPKRRLVHDVRFKHQAGPGYKLRITGSPPPAIWCSRFRDLSLSEFLEFFKKVVDDDDGKCKVDQPIYTRCRLDKVLKNHTSAYPSSKPQYRNMHQMHQANRTLPDQDYK